MSKPSPNKSNFNKSSNKDKKWLKKFIFIL